MTTRSFAGLALATACIAALAGCGTAAEADGPTGTPDAPTTVSATFTSLYGDYFSNCKSCHAPGAPGRTSDTEQNLDFTSKTTAYSTITTKMAAGLVGNPADCNGVPFVASGVPGKSLILAVVDQPTRNVFDDPAHPKCDMDTISDETAKVHSQPSAAFVASLKQWITDGTPNN